GLTRGEILCGGAVPLDAGLADGAYFPPTLIDGVDPAAPLAQEEIFGPVLTVNTFAGEDEAVALANGTEYARLAALWARALSRAPAGGRGRGGPGLRQHLRRRRRCRIAVRRIPKIRLRQGEGPCRPRRGHSHQNRCGETVNPRLAPAQRACSGDQHNAQQFQEILR